ncbi:Phosphoribulokinase/uridine kinase [Penicillium angulare]|uniref:Phosphoribulokinase/uridine kinase n=1 Tax=Penicillium angulare TaxID=116970 RepID=A0A9W9KKS4_9EURO|nr:Phosphoribulokinase/uridine kinase [Penicillium angulare]
MASPPQKQSTIIVGISGPSSSGKTTLARLLQQIFCGVDLQLNPESTSQESEKENGKLNTFIIHEDDFYYPDDQIPYTTTKSGKIQDWDTIGAIDTSFLAQALLYVRENGRLPPRLQSKEDQNESSHSGVEESLVSEMRNLVQKRLAGTNTNTNARAEEQIQKAKTIAFMEGFLLYTGQSEKSSSPLKPVQDAIHLPLFLPAAYTNVKTRREARSGYVTIGPQPTQEEIQAQAQSGTGSEQTHEHKAPLDLEAESDQPPQNFWVDPPGYVDDIVWPRYVEDHAWLLVAEEGEGDLVSRVGEGVNVREDAGVVVAPGKGDVGMDVILRWAVGEILNFYDSF